MTDAGPGKVFHRLHQIHVVFKMSLFCPGRMEGGRMEGGRMRRLFITLIDGRTFNSKWFTWNHHKKFEINLKILLLGIKFVKWTAMNRSNYHCCYPLNAIKMSFFENCPLPNGKCCRWFSSQKILMEQCLLCVYGHQIDLMSLIFSLCLNW